MDARSALADADDLRCMMAFLQLAADVQPDEAEILERVVCYVMPQVCYVMPQVSTVPVPYIL